MSKTVGATFNASATCAGGKTVIGGGFRLTQGSGGTPSVAAASASYISTPGVDGTWTVTGVVAVAGNGGSATPTVQAYAICAD